MLQHVRWADDNKHFFMQPHCAWDVCNLDRELALIGILESAQVKELSLDAHTRSFSEILLQLLSSYLHCQYY